MKYTEPKFERVELDASDIIMSAEPGFNPDKPGLGEEERE